MNKTAKGVLRILVSTVGLLFVVWMYVAQPGCRPAPEAVVAAPISAPELKETVKTLSIDFHPRNHQHPENLKRTAEWIADHFRKAGGQVELQPYVAWGVSFENVSCFFDGPGERRIVVGAHYDSYGNTPGADDNASGIAGLIELAYRMKNLNPGCDVELVAYCTEEPPYFGSKGMGSYAHAKKIHEEGVDVVGMIALEMIGYFTDEADTQSYPMPALGMVYPSSGSFIAVISGLDQRDITGRVKQGMKKGKDLSVYSFIGPVSLPGIDFSDHRNYWEFGFPAVMITDTAFFRNTEYHEAGDTWDRLDYDRMMQVVESVGLAVVELSKP